MTSRQNQDQQRRALKHIEEGNRKLEQDDNMGAIREFEKAVQLNSQNPDAYRGRGCAKGRVGDHEGALEDFNEVIRLNPEDDEAYNNRGLAKRCSNDYVGAVEDFTKSIDLNPKDPGVYYNLGMTLEAKKAEEGGDKEEDINWIEKAFRLAFEEMRHGKVTVFSYSPINVDSLENVCSQSIWMSHPSVFNDPMEGILIEKFRLGGLTLKAAHRKIRVKSFVEERDMEESHVNTLMWSHYGDAHQGILLEYELNLEELSMMGVMFEIITYKDDNALFFDDNRGHIKSAYFTKSTEWKSERECRLITTSDSLIDGHRLQSKNGVPFFLKSVTFGLRTTEERRGMIMRMLKEEYSNGNLKFFLITRDEEFDLKLKRVPIE